MGKRKQRKEPTESEAWFERKMEHYQAITELNAEAVTAMNMWLAAKQETSELKKRYDHLAAELQKVISEGPDPQVPLPFEDEAE